MSTHPDMLPGTLSGIGLFITVIFACALFFPINRADFFRGFALAWITGISLLALIAIIVLISTKLFPPSGVS